MLALRRYCIMLICLPISGIFGEEERLLYDETQFTNPLSFEYNFDDDSNNGATDYNDIYDEYIPVLPGFHVHKNGVDIGYTKLPIVTRKGLLWSTLTTEPQDVEPYRGWHTTPVPRHVELVNHPVLEEFGVEQMRSKTSDLISEDPKEVRTGDLRFEKFARRFGVNRLPVEYTATTAVIPQFTTKKVSTALQKDEPKKKEIELSKAKISNVQQDSKGATSLSVAEYISTEFAGDSESTTPSNIHVTITRQASIKPKKYHIESTSTTKRVMEKKSTVKPKRVVLKPLLVSTKDAPYKGPTYGCPVLNPARDAVPSKTTNLSCSMKEPGFSANGKCRCTYEVTKRDDRGCALNYVYTCTPR